MNITALREKLATETGPRFWRSLEELGDDPEFQEYLHEEFPRQVAPLESAVDRRGFLKFLGASLALAGLTACARPLSAAEKVVPYVRQPEEIVPGKPLFFASAITSGGYAEGVLVESHQGRPTKLEGNADHPASLGATTAVTQASILSLYDPDRSQEVLKGGSTAGWEDFVAEARAALEASGDGSGVAIVTEPVTSPSFASRLRAFLEQYPAARWVQHDSTGLRRIYSGTELAFGEPLMPDYDMREADVVVSFGADFISDYPGRLRYAKHLSERRRIRSADDDMSRLWVFEPTPSPLGAIADHRIPAGEPDIVDLITAVAVSLGVEVDGGASADAPAGIDAGTVEAVVADLNGSRGRSVAVAGQHLPAEAQALVHAINDVLGNEGTTVTYLRPPEAVADTEDGLSGLASDLEAGEISAVFLLGVNPVHTAPAALDFGSALKRADFSAHLGLYADETAEAAGWHVPQAHFLETWSDTRAYDGTITIAQPLIRPFYGGRTENELLAAVLGEDDAGAYRLLNAYWSGRVSGNFDSFWRKSLYSGSVSGTRSETVSPTLQTLSAPEADRSGNWRLAFRPDPSVEDGRWANNGWLQEVPKPFTKLVWDNAALIAPADAEKLGVMNGHLLTIKADGRDLTIPAWILPGQVAGTVTLHLGFGREAAGRIGTGIGSNANAVRPAGSFSAAADISVAGGSHELVSTQIHHALEGTGELRHLVRQGTLEEFRAEPEQPLFVNPVPHHESDLYPDFEYKSYKWGMVIDMNVCTGCNACVVACQSENNIPIVGKDQVAVGREMHWLRIDNYYSGSIDNPEYHHQPMLCQHCEKAPCEPVCPVGATVHDHEGLNVMVYNRCVGTRYCSNNCPFKVRRFNYLQYAELSNTSTELSMASNPDVTVRSRGVMEKCTYCTQRISAARITAGNEGRTIRDGEVVTACQAACPTDAIVFGDLNDPESRVSQERKSPLNYTLLEELNLFPRNTYVAKVRNVSPEAGGVS